MALPAYLKAVPRTIGDTTFTYAHFIVDALEGLPRNRFIKSMLRTLPGYLNNCSARQEKSIQENGSFVNRNDYVEILDNRAEGSNDLGGDHEEDKEGLAKASAIEDEAEAEQ
jgi:hypothetical protein